MATGQSQESVLSGIRTLLKGVYGGRLAGLRLYGSRARGDAASDSDYDILIVLEDPVTPREERRRIGEGIYGLCQEYDAVILCHVLSRSRFEREASPFLLNIRKESVAV